MIAHQNNTIHALYETQFIYTTRNFGVNFHSLLIECNIKIGISLLELFKRIPFKLNDTRFYSAVKLENLFNLIPKSFLYHYVNNCIFIGPMCYYIGLFLVKMELFPLETEQSTWSEAIIFCWKY